jgi:OmcA/MtrC family decaheme c-type cytochrome
VQRLSRTTGIAPTFHAGQRNDAQTCSFCHTANKVNSGWSVNIKDAVHAIHAAGKRTNKFSWEANQGDKFWGVTYPGYLRNCEQCHLTGTYDFSAPASSAAIPNLLWSTTASNTILDPTYASPNIYGNAFQVILTGNETVTSLSTVLSPFVAANTAYGIGFSFAGAVGAGTTTEAAATTLVNSPIASACFACHDDGIAIGHMRANGGTIYGTRLAIGANNEACLTCHGSGKVVDIKAVHRWW